MNMQELNELDFSNIGDWPAIVKVLLILILCVQGSGRGDERQGRQHHDDQIAPEQHGRPQARSASEVPIATMKLT